MYIGKKLRMIRKDQGLSLRELSEASGIDECQISQIECGIVLPSNEELKKMEEVLKIDFWESIQISESIDELCDDFLDALFYQAPNYEVFKVIISMGKNKHKGYGKVQLIEYILLILEGELEKARQLENELFEYFKNDNEYEAILFQYKGLSYRLEKRYSEAITWFEKAESQRMNTKNRAMLMIHLSIAYSKTQRIIQAMQCVRSAREIFTEYGSIRWLWDCFVEYGSLLTSYKHYQEAIESFKIALRTMKMIDSKVNQKAKIYRNMCQTMICAQDYNAGLKYLNEAKLIEPKHPRTVLYGIWCNYKLKNYEEAENIIMNNTQLMKDVDHANIYELFSLLVKYEDNKPSNEMINLAGKIVNDLMDNKENELACFFIELVLDLLDRCGNELAKLNFLKMRINL